MIKPDAEVKKLMRLSKRHARGGRTADQRDHVLLIGRRRHRKTPDLQPIDRKVRDVAACLARLMAREDLAPASGRDT